MNPYVYISPCLRMPQKKKIKPYFILKALLMMTLAGIYLAGCIQPNLIQRIDDHDLDPWVAKSEDKLWSPPRSVVSEPKPETNRPDVPPDLLNSPKKWQLSDIIEVALRNNPDTRAAWYAARAAAADWQSKQGDRYPQIDIAIGAQHIERISPKFNQEQSISTFGPSVELSWLLYDFGGRDAAIEEKRQTLMIMDFQHNMTIQDLVFNVLQTYFQYANAKSLANAMQTSVDEAETNLLAAQDRHDHGLATIADVLQAKTAFSSAQLNLDIVSGQIQIIRGALATAMGVPADLPYDIADLPLNPPLDLITRDVDDYIRQAQALRPDLAAQKSRVEQAMVHVKTVRSATYPSLVIDHQFSETIDDSTSRWEGQNTTSLLCKVPLFKGHSRRYDILKSEQDLQYQQAALSSLKQKIIFQVWSSYFNFKTSVQRVKTTDDLLNSAQQSYEVALGRYKEGVGGFLNLLAAQSTLENARAQRFSARSDWFILYAQLAHDTGALWGYPHTNEKSIFDVFPSTSVKELQK